MASAKWPVWATERVEIAVPRSDWSARGEREREALEAALAAWVLGRVEHVGSTAVPGLAAKPILDFQARVADLGCAPRIAAALADQGWHLVPVELNGRDWERFFVRVAHDRRAAHLHLLEADARQWGERLAFRDALRAEPALARAYAAVKADLAARYADDREAYTRGKADFIRGVLGTR
ncbi:MAG: GrpB family protein [Nocardiopsaceae bacterium]|nr:GrpB family protein [Nocardiopsaceae bacterium]